MHGVNVYAKIPTMKITPRTRPQYCAVASRARNDAVAWSLLETLAVDRHLLFGLLALQNGIINQVQLVAAFQAWALDKSRTPADHLEARGDVTGATRAAGGTGRRSHGSARRRRREQPGSAMGRQIEEREFGADWRAQAEAKHAVIDLREPISARFRSITELRADVDFTALKGRHDFELLMMDVAFPADPFFSQSVQ
jgi:hypothetical protein